MTLAGQANLAANLAARLHADYIWNLRVKLPTYPIKQTLSIHASAPLTVMSEFWFREIASVCLCTASKMIEDILNYFRYDYAYFLWQHIASTLPPAGSFTELHRDLANKWAPVLFN